MINKQSNICNEGEEKTIQHLILYCKRYERERGDDGCNYE